jgi:hypothetical protein
MIIKGTLGNAARTQRRAFFVSGWPITTSFSVSRHGNDNFMPEGVTAMPFQKGQSGNPAGRRVGSRNRVSVLVHSLLENEAEYLARKTIDMAKDGNLGAMRMCMDRIAPTRNYAPCCELPHLQNAAAGVEAMARIADAVSTGDLLPAEAAALARVVENYLQALAAHGLDERLTRLEEMAGREPQPGRTIELSAGPPPSVEKSL